MKEKGLIAIKVVPKAHKNEIVGWEGDELKVRLRAVPEKGKANAALLKFLAEEWNLPAASLTLVSGESSRHKKVRIET